MRIDNNSLALTQAVQNSASARAQSKPHVTENDNGVKAEFSSDSRVASLSAQLSQVDDVRTDRVAALQQAVNSGTYSIDPARVAGAMMNSLFRVG